jgi:glycosyltransferase involved in cell wall biosynthesis
VNAILSAKGVEFDKAIPPRAPDGTRHRVVVALEQRFEQTSDGTVWGPGTFSQEFWGRYLEVFDKVTVVARIRPVLSPSARFERCNAEAVEFLPVPHYLGPWEFLMRRRPVRRAALAGLDRDCSVIVRIPSPIGSFIVGHVQRLGKPYAVEVVGDPYDVMSPQAFRHPLRPMFRWWLVRQQQNACLGATGAAYVTERTLQQRYPCRGYSVGVSDVRLAPVRERPVAPFTAQYSSVTLTRCVPAPRTYAPRPLNPIALVAVATLSQMYKGLDTLIDAVGRCVANGLDTRLTIVGEGKHQGELEARAAAIGMSQRVRFTGFLEREQVTRELDAADVFVLPSRCEGLPRALIEAMARALPCIASNVGGIPELLEPGDLVTQGNVEMLSRAIIDVASDADRRTAMSAHNLSRANDFRDDLLKNRRVAFYLRVRAATDRWIAQQSVS